MSKFKEEWKSISTYMKFSLATITISTLIIVLMFLLNLLNVISDNITDPIIPFFLGLSLILNGINIYTRKRKLAILFFIAAIFAFISFILYLL